MSEPSRGRAHSRTRFLLALAGAAGGSAALPNVALADDRQACSDAYQKTQELRDADQIDDAVKQAQICARDVCAPWMRSDCSKWQSELEARQSTVVIEILADPGATAADASVLLDGAPWLAHADGAAHVVSKGPHSIEIDVKGNPPQKESVTIAEGEKNRRITFHVAAKAPPVEPRPSDVHRVGPWIVGAVGAAALLAGAVTGGLVLQAHAVMKDECHDPTKTTPGYCSQAGRDAETRGQRLGPATTGLLVGGATLVAAGVIWFVAAPRAAKYPATSAFVVPSLFVTPVLSRHENGVVLGGAW